MNSNGHTIDAVPTFASDEPSGRWMAIRDLKVKEAEHHAAIELRGLTEEARGLEARRVEVAAEIHRMGESESSVATHAWVARAWGLFALGAVTLSILSAWWTVGWFTTLTWEKVALTLSFAVLPLIGWAVLLTAWASQASKLTVRKVMVLSGLVILIPSAVGFMALSWNRMQGVAIQEELAEERATDPEFPSAQKPAVDERIASFKIVSAWITALAVVLLGLAGEVAAGIAYHEYSRHAAVVRTARPYYREWGRLRAAMAENATQQEAVRRRPAILHAQLTAAELERQAALAAEEQKARALMPTLKWGIAGVGILLGVAIASPTPAAQATAELTVVALDVSRSQAPSGELPANVLAVERLIARARTNSRIVVLRIDEASFGAAALFVATAPLEPGRFGEHLAAWRARTVQLWRKVAADLRPSASGSDIVGAIGRAAVEFEEAEARAMKRLVVLSDMRQVGRGVNLERPITEGASVRLHRLSAVNLQGVSVFVLGAHTSGVDERHWRAIRTFWTRFFREAGTTIRSYSPNRRLAEE